MPIEVRLATLSSLTAATQSDTPFFYPNPQSPSRDKTCTHIIFRQGKAVPISFYPCAGAPFVARQKTQKYFP